MRNKWKTRDIRYRVVLWAPIGTRSGFRACAASQA